MQGILGTTLKRPLFTTKFNSDNTIDIFFGFVKISTIPNDKKSMLFKSMISILVSAGVCIRHIEENFGISFKTIKKYSEIFKESKDDTQLENELKNPGRETYKVTGEVYNYIHHRAYYYESTGMAYYHKKIIADVASKYNIKLSRDTIRLTLKKNLKEKTKAQNGEIIGNPGNEEPTLTEYPIDKKDTYSLGFRNMYAGLLLLSPFLELVFNNFPTVKTEDGAYFLKTIFIWWILAFLLEAKNFERQRYFNVEDFEFISGFHSFPTVETMRSILYKLSLSEDTQATAFILKKNVDYFIEEETDYYVDPHLEEYTGKENIVKGWSTLKNRVCKGNFDNFVHDGAGAPIFSLLMDNFYDFRDIIIMILEKIKKIRPKKAITLIYDRGGFSTELMKEISSVNEQFFITWQKGFTQKEGEESNMTEEVSIEYPYNDLGKFKSVHYKFGEDTWRCKDYECRRIIFQKQEDGVGRFYQAILTNEKKLDGGIILKKILKRSLQENDFKKQKAHFGLDEITSYRKIDYNELEDKAQEKKIDNKVYKEKVKEIEKLNKEKKKLIEKVGSSIYKVFQKKKLSSNIFEKNKEIINEIEEINKEIIRQNNEKKKIVKKISKLNQYKQDGKVELDLRCKRILGVLKITGRNIFEKGAKDFLSTYKNLRDYQKVFHKLVNTGGQINIECDTMYVELDSFGRKNFKKRCNEYFQILNQKKLTSIDGKYILQFKCFPD